MKLILAGMKLARKKRIYSQVMLRKLYVMYGTMLDGVENSYQDQGANE
jgi:hypothetical protein